MKLRKLMLAVVAVLATSVAFAGNTSELKYLINQTFLQLENLAQIQEVTAEEQPLVDAATALRAGLLNYEAQLSAGGELSGLNKQIDDYFKTLPTYFNGLDASSLPSFDGVDLSQITSQEQAEALLGPVAEQIADFLAPIVEPVDNQCTKLTKAVLKNQTKVAHADEETASALMTLFALTKMQYESIDVEHSTENIVLKQDSPLNQTGVQAVVLFQLVWSMLILGGAQ